VKTKIVAMGRCLVADIQVEVFAERRVVLISIDVLAPTVQELVQAILTCKIKSHSPEIHKGLLIEVVLLPALTTMGSSGCIRLYTYCQHRDFWSKQRINTWVIPWNQPL
jgi:hypothetical protein